MIPELYDYVYIKDLNGRIIIAGKIINTKQKYVSQKDEDINFKCISFDSKYFFSLQSNEITIENNPNKEKREMDLGNIEVVLWKDVSKNPLAIVYRDYDLTELDDEVVDLVMSLNKINGIKTCSSCCGHKKYNFWIDINFENFNSIEIMLKILSMKEFNDWELVSSKFGVVVDGNSGVIMQLRSKGKSSDKIYKSAQKMSDYIRLLVGE